MGRFQKGIEEKKEMIFSISQTPAAENDILDALRWYALQRPGLDDDFLLSLEAEISLVKRNPFIYAVLHKQIRRALIARFPYAIYYLIKENHIVIIAVVHQKRRPAIWKKRKATR